MQIEILIGSPRKTGNTATLARLFTEMAEKNTTRVGISCLYE